MKRGVAVLVLALMFRTAMAQTQPPATPASQTKTQEASSEPSEEHIYGRKDGVKPPHVTYAPDPEYPKKARKAHKEGVVVLFVVVGGDGLPRDIKVVRGLSPELDEAAIDAAKKWKFAPATKDGKPVAVRINIEINFRL